MADVTGARSSGSEGAMIKAPPLLASRLSFAESATAPEHNGDRQAQAIGSEPAQCRRSRSNVRWGQQRLRTCCASDVPREPLQPHVLLDRMTAHSRERQERSKGPQCGSRSSSASPVTARPVTTVPASSGSPPPAAEDPRAAWCRARLDDVSADLRVAERGLELWREAPCARPDLLGQAQALEHL